MSSVGCDYGGRSVLQGVTLRAYAGELLGILGPNGAGKSTLLRAMAGLVSFTGEIDLLGAPLRGLDRQELARKLAFVAQDPPAELPFTVGELALMGRAPHQGALGFDGPRDREVAWEALSRMGIDHLAQRPIDQLSGGERRRAFLARALAQEPKVLLMDEPTAFLDLGHQAELLELSRARAREGLCAVVVLHDPNLAQAYCDRIALLAEGSLAALGSPSEVLNEQALSALYKVPLARAPAFQVQVRGRS